MLGGATFHHPQLFKGHMVLRLPRRERATANQSTNMYLTKWKGLRKKKDEDRVFWLRRWAKMDMTAERRWLPVGFQASLLKRTLDFELIIAKMSSRDFSPSSTRFGIRRWHRPFISDTRRGSIASIGFRCSRNWYFFTSSWSQNTLACIEGGAFKARSQQYSHSCRWCDSTTGLWLSLEGIQIMQCSVWPWDESYGCSSQNTSIDRTAKLMFRFCVKIVEWSIYATN